MVPLVFTARPAEGGSVAVRTAVTPQMFLAGIAVLGLGIGVGYGLTRPRR